MAISRVIEVSFRGSSVALVRIDTAYFYNNGIIFKPTDIELPTSYQVHWADSPQASTTLETIGTAEGAPIPDDLWSRSRVIYGWIYLHPTEDSGVTGYEVRIYKNVRAGLPDGTEPTPAEQSTIDQLIGALNSAVDQTGEDVESASQSAQSAESAKTAAESARDTAGEYANDAQNSAESASESARVATEKATASAQSASQSAQIKADVEDLADDAQSYAESALIASQASVTARDTAQGHALSASASAQSASTSASNASASANTASTKASEASTSAQTASQKATEASQSAENALSYKTDAESAKTASQTAQGLAESARDTAVSAKTDAESARDDAVQAKEDAESAVASISGALDEKAPVITDTASGAIASFSDGADNLPLKSLVVDINPIQDLSHGDPSPENICHISGWTEVDVEQSGVNVFDNGMTLEDGYISPDTGQVIASYNAYNKHTPLIPIAPSISLVANKVQALAANNTLKTFFAGWAYYDINKNFISGKWNPSATDTPPTNARFLVLSVTGSTINNNYFTPETIADFVKDYCLAYGSTATPYESYTGRSITIQLGQTVYGGKLDVLSGVLTVDRAMVDLGTLNWISEESDVSGQFRVSPAEVIPLNPKYSSVQCSILKGVAPKSYSSFNKGEIGLSNSLTTPILRARAEAFIGKPAEEIRAIMQNQQLVYELATPIEIQLTPNQVNSLLGVNNLWADSGDTEVEYRADTKLFIERLTAPDSADMIADANITSGQYFMVGNSLYKATANIANGSAIVVGTNCIRKSLSEALNEINA